MANSKHKINTRNFGPSKMLAVLMMLLFTSLWSRADVTPDQLSFSPLYGEDDTTVIGYSVSRNPDIEKTALSGVLNIPESYNSLPVTALADYSFMECSEITSVNIPSSVTIVGTCAFRLCKKLESASIPTTVNSLGPMAFSASALTAISLPANLTEISSGLLEGTQITEIDIPATVTKIGYEAFFGTNLKSVNIPASVETIEYGAFQRCYSLENVTFNEGLKRINNGNWAGAFMDCTSLKELIFPSTLEYIGDMAFVGCSNLETITFPASIGDFGSFAFAQCIGLKKVICLGNYGVNTYYNLFSTSAEKFVQTDSYMAIYNRCVLNFPFGGSYDSAPWRFFANRLEGIGNHVLESAQYSIEAGSYDEPFTLSLTNPNGRGTLYYMVVPENGSTVGPVEYESPIEVATSSTVRTWISDGDDCSDVAVNAYELATMTIEVAGIQVNSKNCYDVLGDKGSVMFDTKSEVLTLRNANINTTDYKADCGIRAFGGDLVIEVCGDNVIKTDNLGIEYGYAYGKGTGGNLTIRGGDPKGGIPSLTFEFEGKWSMGAIYLYLANLNVENCNIYIKNFTSGIEAKAAPKNGGGLNIENSTIDIKAEQAAIRGIYDLNLGKGIVVLLPSTGEFKSAYEGDGKGDFGGIFLDGEMQKRVVIGPEVPPIPQITEETTVNFGSTISNDTDLSDTTIDDVHYNLDPENGNGYNQEDGCIEITSTVSSEVVRELPVSASENAYFTSDFQGLVVVVGGTGSVELDCQTTSETCLEVKIGDADPQPVNSPTQGSVTVPYNTTEPVYCYIYAAETSSSSEEDPGEDPMAESKKIKKVKTRAAGDPVKIYSLKIKPVDIVTGIEDVTIDRNSGEDVIYDINGRRLRNADSPGFYIINGKKVLK